MDMFSFLDNWRLPKKLFAAFSILAVLFCIVGFNGYYSTRTLDSIAQSHVKRGLASMSSLADVISNAKEQRIIVYSFYNAVDAKDQASLRERFEAGSAKLVKSVDQYTVVADEDAAADVASLRQKVADLNETNGRIFALRSAGDLAGAMALIKDEGKTRSRAVIDQTEKLIGMTREISRETATEGSDTAELAITLSILLAVAGLAGIVVIWFIINRSVATPMARIASVTTTLAEGGKADGPYRDRQDEIGQIAVALDHFRLAGEKRAEADARAAAEQQVVTTSLRESLSAMTKGDLSHVIAAEFPPAYAELKGNFNAALGSLRELIGAVTESAAAIRTGSSEIAQASDDLARRTESNAASLEETSAAITQMDNRLRATAAAAGRTVQRADGAMTVVDSGRSIADEAVQAMGRVSESAKGIDSVIEGLDKIAFQTRVLAMNAAVEAGRAGDAGRGFAVVADLVSALAMRSEEEAKRAREQLTATQADIGTAVDAVQKVDGALENISTDVSEVHTLLSEIASDNQAQSSTITQISTAIGTMDQATQQNAAMVEETSAAARNLNSEVSALADRAAMFNIGGTANRAPARGTPISFSPASATPPKAMSKMTSPDDWLEF
jgi:methyl-accepting chemotaxis protein